jgi:hypothetical protein
MGVVVGEQEFLVSVVAFISVGLSVVVLVLLELRAQWKQREDLNRLLILALFRMSKRQIATLEEQTRHIDVLLAEFRVGNLARAQPADVRDQVDAAAPGRDHGAEDIAAEQEIEEFAAAEEAEQLLAQRARKTPRRL